MPGKGGGEFEESTAVLLKTPVLWHVTLRRWASVYRRLYETYLCPIFYDLSGPSTWPLDTPVTHSLATPLTTELMTQ